MLSVALSLSGRKIETPQSDGAANTTMTKRERESKTKRLHKLLWSAGNRAMPQHLLDEITKLKKELASSSDSDTLLLQ